MSLNIVIVEDEAVLAETARMLLESLGYTITGVAHRYADAINMFREKDFDLALLDINLGEGKEGIDLAAHLNEHYRKPFMFVTSYADPATIGRAKDVRPAAYVMKPFSKEDLFAAIEIAMIQSAPEEEPFVLLKEGHDQIKVAINDILWLKSDNIYVEVNTTDKRYLQRTSLEQLLSQLPEAHFIRTHRSYAVNVKKMERIKGGEVLVNGVSIPLSRKNKEAVMARFKG